MVPRRPRKILVVGFSVLAERDGFLEAARTHPDWPGDIETVKVGIGGIHSIALKFLWEELLTKHRPDAVVAEIATSALRNMTNFASRHEDALRFMLDICNKRGVAFGMFDLPRRDYDTANDPVCDLHKTLCEASGLSYLRVAFRDDFVKDAVHPTAAGKLFYAGRFVELVSALLKNPKVPAAQNVPILYRSLRLTCFRETEIVFERSGYEIPVVPLSGGRTLDIELPGDCRLVGVSMIFGPKSGAVEISDGIQTRRLVGHDRFCYYERLQCLVFAALKGSAIRLHQNDALPDVILRKGTPDTGPRLGQFGHLFVAQQ